MMMKRDYLPTTPRDVAVTDLAAHLTSVYSVLESGDLSESMRECHKIGTENVTQAFVTKTSPTGEAWLQRKVRPGRKDDGHPLGVLSGSMAQAATGGAGSVTQIGSREMGFGVDLSAPRLGVPQTPWKHNLQTPNSAKKETLIYSARFNFGSADGRQPARGFLGFNEQGKRDCATVIMDDVSAHLQAV